MKMRNFFKINVFMTIFFMTAAAFAFTLPGRGWQAYTLTNNTGQTIYVQYASQHNLDEGANHKVISPNNSGAYQPLHRSLFTIANGQTFTIAYRQGFPSYFDPNKDQHVFHTDYQSSLHIKILTSINQKVQKVMNLNLYSNKSWMSVSPKKSSAGFLVSGGGSAGSYVGEITKV